MLLQLALPKCCLGLCTEPCVQEEFICIHEQTSKCTCPHFNVYDPESNILMPLLHFLCFVLQISQFTKFHTLQGDKHICLVLPCPVVDNKWPCHGAWQVGEHLLYCRNGLIFWGVALRAIPGSVLRGDPGGAQGTIGNARDEPELAAFKASLLACYLIYCLSCPCRRSLEYSTHTQFISFS